MARAGALQADRRAGRAAGARGPRQGRGARGRGARHERQARWRESGDTAMLAYDTAEGPTATRPRLLRHGASARGHARPGRWVGVLAGSIGPSWCTVHLAQF